MRVFDYVIVGGGHNALVAAAYLSRAGYEVVVVERNDRVGGYVHSAELAPGVVYDPFASAVPLFVGGPVWPDLGAELEKQGLVILHTEHPTGISLEDGTTAIFPQDSAVLTEEAERLHPGDGAAVAAIMSALGPATGDVLGLMCQDLTSAQARATIARLVRDGDGWSELAALALDTARSAVAELGSPAMRSLFGSWPAHGSKGPDDAGGALWTTLFPAGFAVSGMPIPQGGVGRLADALGGLVTSKGGTLHTGATVTRIRVEGGRAVGAELSDGTGYRARLGVIASVNPDQLYEWLLAETEVPERIRAQARRYRYGSGIFQLHLAVAGPLPWPDKRFERIGQPFLTDSLDGLSLHVAQARAGLLPASPTMTIDCPTAHDPTRAPVGTSVVRLQVTDVPPRPRGDAAGRIDTDGTWNADVTNHFADRVLGVAERHLPGLTDSVLARATVTPATLAAYNPNSGHGDPYSGAQDLAQSFLLRPMAAAPGHRTFIPNLHVVGAGTWPGAGISGSSGYIVAKEILAR
ncbi:phytoene desaturase family protein [Nocardia arthritidis]|uniref:Pyridine nucleotide-disulfide oxidoreductase domain-containing protein 2 n=1 Tax=Nocardia arthritidis TaxID=228602 RepID=A0A6G9YIK8_9NOCA|nr:NAD(P)/FAD-dependent oxidoreductase [Nocardia arthritidis]QIS12897.1 NAD(P)-binding protein [Nocardia arthritidis]